MRVAVTTIVGSERGWGVEADAADCAKAAGDQHAAGTSNATRTARGNPRWHEIADGQHWRRALRGRHPLLILAEHDIADACSINTTLRANIARVPHAIASP
jgi:uncharacterized protein YjiS (DUF1127 family)